MVCDECDSSRFVSTWCLNRSAITRTLRCMRSTGSRGSIRGASSESDDDGSDAEATTAKPKSAQTVAEETRAFRNRLGIKISGGGTLVSQSVFRSTPTY